MCLGGVKGHWNPLLICTLCKCHSSMPVSLTVCAQVVSEATGIPSHQLTAAALGQLSTLVRPGVHLAWWWWALNLCSVYPAQSAHVWVSKHTQGLHHGGKCVLMGEDQDLKHDRCIRI